MATHKGSEGVIKVGSNTVAEITGYTLTENAETIETTELSDSAKTFDVGNTSWNGSLECHWDETDTTGQGSMTIGASVTLNMYPEGDATGDTYWSGTALITGISSSAAINGLVESSLTFQGTGALTKTTVS
jgi:hypothetical protein